MKVGVRTMMVLGVLAMSASGCTRRIWFSQDLRESFELGVQDTMVGGEAGLGGEERWHDPGDLQFFTSERIVLEREANSRRDELARGRIIARRGRFIERVVVRRGTPGVAVDWGTDWVDISFAPETSLRFELVQSRKSNQPGREREPAGVFGDPLPASYYELQVAQKESGHSVVSFDGIEYTPVGATATARLKVRRRKIQRWGRSRRVLRGRRLE